MYELHYKGKADILGFRNLGVRLRGMSPDAVIANSLDVARSCGLSGPIAQIDLARLMFESFNPVTVDGIDNVVNPGQDVHLWTRVQVLQNGLQDLVKNGLGDNRLFRCDRNGDPVPLGGRAWGYNVLPFQERDIELDIQTAWIEPC